MRRQTRTASPHGIGHARANSHPSVLDLRDAPPSSAAALVLVAPKQLFEVAGRARPRLSLRLPHVALAFAVLLFDCARPSHPRASFRSPRAALVLVVCGRPATEQA